MNKPAVKCFFCGNIVEQEYVGRRDECQNCENDLHCCLQCKFYDTAYADACREPQAEPVAEKDRSNFCSYFSFGREDTARVTEKSKIKNTLDDLFKKKG